MATDFDKTLKRALADVQRGVKNLEKLGLKIEAHETETMYGSAVTLIYAVDKLQSGKVILQKHLFTIR